MNCHRWDLTLKDIDWNMHDNVSDAEDDSYDNGDDDDNLSGVGDGGNDDAFKSWLLISLLVMVVATLVQCRC